MLTQTRWNINNCLQNDNFDNRDYLVYNLANLS